MQLLQTSSIRAARHARRVLGSRSSRVRLLLTASLAAIAFFALPASSVPQTLDVCPSGCTSTTIQGAIDAASAGDTITVAAGTYAEALTIGVSLTIEGPNAAISPNDVALLGSGLPSANASRVAEAIIRPGAADGDALTIAPGVADLTIALRGLTFDLADAPGTSADDPAAARFITGSANENLDLTVEHTRFLNNPGAENGSWWLVGDNGNLSLSVLDNRFTGERYATNGIAHWNYGAGATTVLDIRDNVWVDNKGWATNGGSTTGTSGVISDNWVGNTTPGVSQSDGWQERQNGFLLTGVQDHLLVSGNTFVNIEYSAVNFYTAYDGSGITFSGPVSIEHNLFDGYSNMGYAYDDGYCAYATPDWYEGDLLVGPNPTAPCDAATSDVSGVTLRDNAFLDPTVDSVTVGNRGTSSAPAIDAQGNYWDCAGGPGGVGCPINAGPVTSDFWISSYTMPASVRSPGFWPETKTIGLPAITEPTTVPLGGTSLGSASIGIQGASAGATVEVEAPTKDDLPAAVTPPFSLSGATFIDIQVTGTTTGPYTICLDGDRATDKLWHYEETATPGTYAWVDMTWRDMSGGTLTPGDYPASQICGETDTLSPFASSSTKTALTVTPDDMTVTYGDAAPVTADYTFDVAGFVGADDENTAAGYVPPTCTSTYSQGQVAGTTADAVTCSGGTADDYTFDVTAKADLIVDTVDISVAPPAYGGSLTYGDTEPSWGTFTVTSGALVLSDSWTTNPTCDSAYAAGSPAGPYGVTCTGGAIANGASTDVTSSYTITRTPLDFTVGLRPITIDADDKTITFGEAAPSFTITRTAGTFFTGDSWTTLPTCSAPTYTPGVSLPGTYEISCSGGVISNLASTVVTSSYDITFTPGTLTVQSALTSVTYTGQTYDADGGGTSSLTATVAAQSTDCFVDSSVTATVTPLGGSALAPIAMTSGDSGASRTYSVSATLPAGIYEVDIAFDPAESCLPSSYDDAVLAVVSAGGTANGGGWYRLDKGLGGSPRLNFGFSITKSTSRTGVISYRGQLLWMNSGKWRLAGTISSTGTPYSYGTTTCPSSVGTAADRRCASFTGTGLLQMWDGDSWEPSTYGVVTFTVTVYDGGTSKVTVGKKTTTVQNPDSFGIQVDPVPSSAIRESSPILLSGGSIKAS